MVLTDQELIDNAKYVFLKYHQDEGYIIQNYLTFQLNYEYLVSNGELTITRWDLDSAEPTTTYLKTTYSVSDLDAIKHICEDVLYLQNSKYTALTTTDRLELTDYALEGCLVYDKNDSTLYIFTDGNWISV